MFFTGRQPKAVIEIHKRSDVEFFIGIENSSVGREVAPDGSELMRILLHEVFDELVLKPCVSVPGEPPMGYGGNIISVKVYPEVGPAFYVGINKPVEEPYDMDDFIDEFLDETIRWVDHWEYDDEPDNAPGEAPEASQPADVGETNPSKQPEIFVLLSKQDTEEYGGNTNLRFFKNQENARQSMMSIYNRTKDVLGWPDHDDPAKEFYIIITADSISVKDGEDSHEWQIIAGIPEDGEVEA